MGNNNKSLSQGDAVYQATIEVMGEFDGSVSETITKEQRSEIVTRVFEMFKGGLVTFKNSSKHDTDSKIRSYVTGLVSNWHRKDRRLNGGVAYVPKNPGSRPSDATLRNLRALRVKFVDEADKLQAIDESIAAREAELDAAKPKQSNVDFTKVPSDLLSKLGLN